MDFNSYVRGIKWKAVLFLVLCILSTIALGVVIEPSAAKSSVLITCLVFLIIGVITIFFFYKKEYSEKDMEMRPFELKCSSGIQYSDLYSALERKCKSNACFQFSESSAFFEFKNKYTVRTILYRTNDFNKKEFDEEKKKINKKANELYKIRQWIPMNSARKFMRVNVIYTDNINHPLLDYISEDAKILLTRFEGVLNLVVCGDQLIVPPLKPTLFIYAVDRYKNMVNMFLKLLSEESK